MKQVINKILNVDRKVLVFLIVICIIGIITGSLFMTILDSNDKTSIIDSLNTFLTEYDHLNTKSGLINNLIINIMYVLIIWIMGISIIGLPIVIFIIFLKSFLISFTTSSFILKYKSKGILLSLVYNVPHYIINLIVYVYLGIYSIKLSLMIIDNIFHKKEIKLKYTINRYIFILCLSIIMIIITTLYETYLMPILLKKVIGTI